MLELAHQKYGKLPWARLFEPAIKLADDGFPGRAQAGAHHQELHAAAPSMPDIKRAFLSSPTARRWRKARSTRIRNMPQALRKIAAGGPKAFYTGEIAQAIVDTVQHAPRQSGRHDLGRSGRLSRRRSARRCAATIASGISARWARPRSGGIAIVQILGMLQRFPSSQLQPDTRERSPSLHPGQPAGLCRPRQISGRSPPLCDVPIAGLLDKDYIASRAALIDPAKDMGTAAGRRSAAETCRLCAAASRRCCTAPAT